MLAHALLLSYFSLTGSLSSIAPIRSRAAAVTVPALAPHTLPLASWSAPRPAAPRARANGPSRPLVVRESALLTVQCCLAVTEWLAGSSHEEGRRHRQVRYSLRRVAPQADQEDRDYPARKVRVLVLRQGHRQAQRGWHLDLPRVQEAGRRWCVLAEHCHRRHRPINHPTIEGDEGNLTALGYSTSPVQSTPPPSTALRSDNCTAMLRCVALEHRVSLWHRQLAPSRLASAPLVLPGSAVPCPSTAAVLSMHPALNPAGQHTAGSTTIQCLFARSPAFLGGDGHSDGNDDSFGDWLCAFLYDW